MNVTWQVLVGSPQSAILEEAKHWKAELIVVGCHGYGPWRRLVLGSSLASYRVTRDVFR